MTALCVEQLVTAMAAGVMMALALSSLGLDLWRPKRARRDRRITPRISSTDRRRPAGNGMAAAVVQLERRRLIAKIKKAIGYYKKNPSPELRRKIILALEQVQVQL